MGCAEYQERINELALAPAGTRPEPKLAQHLVVCNACGEELARRQALLAQIDLGVAALVATDVPQSLAARVRQQIAMEEAKSRSVFAAYRWFWIEGAGAAIATAAILLTFALRSANRTAAPHESVATNAPTLPLEVAHPKNPPSEAASTMMRPKPEVPVVSPKNTAQPAQRDAVANALSVAEATAPSLEVMIPANERFGIRQLVYAARHDQADEAMVSNAGEVVPLAPAESKPPEPLELKPLKIDLIGATDGQQSNSGSGRN